MPSTSGGLDRERLLDFRVALLARLGLRRLTGWALGIEDTIGFRLGEKCLWGGRLTGTNFSYAGLVTLSVTYEPLLPFLSFLRSTAGSYKSSLKPCLWTVLDGGIDLALWRYYLTWSVYLFSSALRRLTFCLSSSRRRASLYSAFIRCAAHCSMRTAFISTPSTASLEWGIMNGTSDSGY